MKRTLIALILAAGAGCASSYHARYESPNPPRVVVPTPAPGAVVVTPPPQTVTVQTAPSSVVVPAITENEAAEIARSEAYRHGWRNAGVDYARFWENHWEVEVYNHPHKAVENHGWVDIAPDGSVLGFSTRHEHAGYYRR